MKTDKNTAHWVTVSKTDLEKLEAEIEKLRSGCHGKLVIRHAELVREVATLGMMNDELRAKITQLIAELDELRCCGNCFNYEPWEETADTCKLTGYRAINGAYVCYNWQPKEQGDE